MGAGGGSGGGSGASGGYGMGGGGGSPLKATAAAGAASNGNTSAGASRSPGQALASSGGSSGCLSSVGSSSCGGGSSPLLLGGSRSPPRGSSASSAVQALVLKLRAVLLGLRYSSTASLSSSLASPDATSFARALRGGVLLMVATLGLLFSLQAIARHRANAISYANSGRARVVGGSAAAARAGEGVMGSGDCIPADIMLGGRLGPSGDGWRGRREAGSHGQEALASGNSSRQRPIPMVATNLDFDTERYLTRFLSGLDYPIGHTLVAWGGCDPLVAEQVAWVLQEKPHVHVYRARQPLGCAGGWNAALQYMSAHDDVPWALVANSDIWTPPGALAAFAAEVWAAVEADPTLCLGHFATEGAGQAGRYTAFVYTRHALGTLGLVDANIYPAYYEDVELDIRMQRAVAAGACSPIRTFNASRFVHGKEGETRYTSGSKVAQKRLMAHGDKAARVAARAWAERIRRGKLSSPLYLEQKWGCRPQADIDLASCRFAHPFDDPRRPLSFWELDSARRRCIDDPAQQGAGAGAGAVCPYTLDEDERRGQGLGKRQRQRQHGLR